ncbi:hypothetical protein L3X38_002667 [Prunus dulcis]|uniref:Alpha/beta hydrolase fold-3 domain-containing protein n=1 Tax=Prunus dulcis TaxID=3755 RepID=A0AAD4ZLB3_PRUDU|nr:hypothetical protein L3X38_002667 [Prunus dulcis]
MASTTKELAFKGDPETGVSSKDITISHNPNISARLYLPNLPQNQIQKLPILVYFHGGVFCIESAFSLHAHSYLNWLVSEAQVVAVSVEYRLAQRTYFLFDVEQMADFVAVELEKGQPKGEDFEKTLEYKAWDFVYPSAPGGLDNPMLNPVGEVELFEVEGEEHCYHLRSETETENVKKLLKRLASFLV